MNASLLRPSTLVPTATNLGPPRSLTPQHLLPSPALAPIPLRYRLGRPAALPQPPLRQPFVTLAACPSSARGPLLPPSRTAPSWPGPPLQQQQRPWPPGGSAPASPAASPHRGAAAGDSSEGSRSSSSRLSVRVAGRGSRSGNIMNSSWGSSGGSSSDMRSGGPFYAVAVGWRTGVFRSWGEAEKAVSGFSGAVYRKFHTEREARQYVAEEGQPGQQQQQQPSRALGGLAGGGGGAGGGIDKRPYYAVAKGQQVGILRSWEETQAVVDGVSGSIYKRFSSRGEAERFLLEHGVRLAGAAAGGAPGRGATSAPSTTPAAGGGGGGAPGGAAAPGGGVAVPAGAVAAAEESPSRRTATAVAATTARARKGEAAKGESAGAAKRAAADAPPGKRARRGGQEQQPAAAASPLEVAAQQQQQQQQAEEQEGKKGRKPKQQPKQAKTSPDKAPKKATQRGEASQLLCFGSLGGAIQPDMVYRL
ncbi:hypothetical protein Agub_g13840, partial [Astrephomene gubernaculifera]